MMMKVLRHFFIVILVSARKRVILPGRNEDELQMFTQNDLGYTFIGFANPPLRSIPLRASQVSTTDPETITSRTGSSDAGGSVQWNLQFLGEGERGDEGLIAPANDRLTSAFVFHELAGFWEPNQRGCLFCYAIKVNLRHNCWRRHSYGYFLLFLLTFCFGSTILSAPQDYCNNVSI